MNFDKAGRYAAAGAIGFEALLPMVGGALIGHYLDQHFHTDPLLTLIMFFVGMIGGFWRLFQFLRIFQKQLGKEK